MINIRKMLFEDAFKISEGFAQQGWNKSVGQYEKYFNEQEDGQISILIVEVDNEFAGHLMIHWISDYGYFKKNDIPEIMDFFILEKFQGRGIGTKLITAAEEIIMEEYSQVGLTVAVVNGKAQRLYCRLGYIPDGQGMSKKGRFFGIGEKVDIDYDLIIGLVKP